MPAPVGIIASSSGATQTELLLPGGTSNNSGMTTPDHATFPNADFDAYWVGVLDDVTRNDVGLIGHWNTTGTNRSWSLRIWNVSGVVQLRLYISPDGTTNTFSANGTAVLPATNGQYFGARATRRQSDGLTRFYYSPTDPLAWTLLGETTVPTATLRDSTGILQVGGSVTATVAGGYFRYGRVLNGFDGVGTVVASPDVRAVPDTNTVFTDSTGKVWSLVGIADLVTRPRG